LCIEIVHQMIEQSNHHGCYKLTLIHA
jgi:hypothetical protein